MTHNITLSTHHGVLYVREVIDAPSQTQSRATFADVLWSGETPRDVQPFAPNWELIDP